MDAILREFSLQTSAKIARAPTKPHVFLLVHVSYIASSSATATPITSRPLCPLRSVGKQLHNTEFCTTASNIRPIPVQREPERTNLTILLLQNKADSWESFTQAPGLHRQRALYVQPPGMKTRTMMMLGSIGHKRRLRYVNAKGRPMTDTHAL